MAQNSVQTSTANKVTGKAVSVLATKEYGGSKLIAPPILATTPGGRLQAPAALHTVTTE